MRNEGPFIVEWVSWYRMLGFEVLVVTNDCTDHSVELLQALQAAGWLHHQGHAPEAGEPPKRSAHRSMHDHPETARADWLLICDVDEFLVLHQDDTVQDYLARLSPPPMGIAFHWRCFGTGGHKRWKNNLVHRTFVTGAPAGDPVNRMFKSMFRKPTEFALYGPHSPRRFTGNWKERGNVWTDCRGKRIGAYHPNENPVKGTTPPLICHELAQMNHYILRSSEAFGLKRGTPSSTAGVDRYTDEFFARFDRGEETDTSALRFAEAFDRIHGQAMDLPQVRRLHYLCCADYAAALARRAGKDPASDRRVQRFLDRASEARAS